VNSGNTTGVVIEDCIIERWGRHGINTGGGCRGWSIVRNLIQDNHWGGILCSAGHRPEDATGGFYIAGNAVLRNGKNGIDCNGSHHRIIGNDVRSSGDRRSSAGFDQWGILLQAITGQDADENIIAHNRCEGSAQHGIILRAADGQRCGRNVVIGNVCVGNGVDSAATGDGVALDGSAGGTVEDNVVAGNIALGNGRNGILLDAFGSNGVSRNVVQGNVCRGNVAHGIWISYVRAADNLISQNVVYDNAAGQITLNPRAAPTRTRVEGATLAPIPDATDRTVRQTVNLVLERLRAQGVIASP
jgi:hypothetical protein